MKRIILKISLLLMLVSSISMFMEEALPKNNYELAEDVNTFHEEPNPW